MGAHNSKGDCCYNAKLSAYYFYVKTKISVDFIDSIFLIIPSSLFHFLMQPRENQVFGSDMIYFVLKAYFVLIYIKALFCSPFLTEVGTALTKSNWTNFRIRSEESLCNPEILKDLLKGLP